MSKTTAIDHIAALTIQQKLKKDHKNVKIHQVIKLMKQNVISKNSIFFMDN